MSGLSCYIVSYDIRDEKRLRKVSKVMKEFGVRLHYSVFRCDMARIDLTRLKCRLSEVINQDQDRVMIMDLGPVKGELGQRLVFLGVGPDEVPFQEAIF